MFIEFFYTLRERGIPVSPTSFLRLQKALKLGMVRSVEDFYTAARAILVKSERYFDTYDQVFAHFFKGVTLLEPDEIVTSGIQVRLVFFLKTSKNVERLSFFPSYKRTLSIS